MYIHIYIYIVHIYIYMYICVHICGRQACEGIGYAEWLMFDLDGPRRREIPKTATLSGVSSHKSDVLHFATNIATTRGPVSQCRKRMIYLIYGRKNDFAG